MGSDNYSEYWEAHGAEKNFSTPFQIEIFSNYVSKNAAVLDVGCGYGRTMTELSGAGYKNVKGVEPSAALRKRGKKLNSGLDIHLLEGGLIPFPNNSFDAVLLVAVLTCIPDDMTQDSLLSEISRVLRADGILYINDFLLNSDKRNLDRYEQFQEKHGTYGIFELPGGGVLRHFSDERIAELLTAFRKIECEKVVYTTMNGNKSNGFYYIGRK